MSNTCINLNPNGRTKLTDTAKIVGVSAMTIRRWILEDKFIPMIKVNGLNFFRNSELITWLEITADGTTDTKCYKYLKDSQQCGV